MESTFDLKISKFIDAVVSNSAYTREQAISVFINTSGLDFSNPIGSVMAAMLARNNSIRVYASKVSPVIWYTDSLHNHKAVIYSIFGEVSDADIKNSYILNEFLPRKIATGQDKRVWISDFNTIEEYKKAYNVA